MTPTKQSADYGNCASVYKDGWASPSRKEASRLEIPSPQINWQGQRTIFKILSDFQEAPKKRPRKTAGHPPIRRLASAGYIAGERSSSLGRKEPSSLAFDD